MCSYLQQWGGGSDLPGSQHGRENAKTKVVRKGKNQINKSENERTPSPPFTGVRGVAEARGVMGIL